MSDGTKIEWTDATANYVSGCSVVSPGCANCYAMRSGGRNLPGHPSTGLTMPSKAGHVWTGEVRANDRVLQTVLGWKRPRRIFWNAHGDLFHPSVPDAWIDRQFAVMALTPQHTHQCLTKRPDRMREYFLGDGCKSRIVAEIATRHPNETKFKAALISDIYDGPLRNVHLGTSVEDQARADERIPHLLATPAAVRFLSCEPLLGPVDLRWIAEPDDEKDGVIDALLGCNWVDGWGRGEPFHPVRPGHQDRVMTRRVCSPEGDILANRKLNWVIVGGESGPGARPMHPDWARSLRDQCAADGVPFHFKQWGEWLGGRWHGDGEMVSFSSPDLSDEARAAMSRLGAQDDRTVDDSWWSRLHSWDDEAMPDGDGPAAFRIGKRAAGRLLDRVAHDGFPA